MRREVKRREKGNKEENEEGSKEKENRLRIITDERGSERKERIRMKNDEGEVKRRREKMRMIREG